MSGEYNIELLLRGCEALGIALTDVQTEQFCDYYRLLIEKNKVMNLTGITEWPDVVTKHFLDSLSLVQIYRCTDKKEIKVLDLGTGAGFPGIPLKIVFPHFHILLLDSLQKRVDFLSEVTDQLKLDHISAVHGRAEDLARQKTYRECFDLVVSRAVANLSVLSEYCIPFVRVGGCFIPYKSGKVQEEFEQAKRAISLLGGSEDIKSVTFNLPDSDIERTLLKISKKRPTRMTYPRKAGTPTKNPL